MQQKCLQFHTSKSFPQTLKILEKEKLEIIFQSTRCRIDFTELTVEEQISWIEEREKYMKRCDELLKKNRGKYESYFEGIISFRAQTKELLKLHKHSPSSYKTSEKYEQFIKKGKKLRESFDFMRLFVYLSDFSDQIPLRTEVTCSCIIAKKGTNLVRYLSFERDPIVTIIGSKASSLKSTLEKQF